MTTEYRGFVFFGQGPVALSAFKKNVDNFMTWCERIGSDPTDDEVWASFNEMMANSR
jgi:hypothetical protein